MFFYFINLLTPVQLSGGLFTAMMAAAAATAADFIDLCKRDQIFTHIHTISHRSASPVLFI